MINAKIICDSLSPQGHRITTFELIYPRIIHSELMTHRLFSRNASSSRAVPVNKIIDAVKNNMFTPFAIQKAHKGMQGFEYFEGEELEQANKLWIESAELALQQAEKMEKFGITKQLINRILEPYQYYKVLLTATEFDNFFDLRCPQYEHPNNPGIFYKSLKDFSKKHAIMGWLDYKYEQRFKINKGQSEIHMMQLAECMWNAMNESVPKQLKAGEYHIPYGDTFSKEGVLREMKYNPTVSNIATADEMFEYYSLRIATAKCARISYTTVGEDNKEMPYEKDIALHDSLIASGHMSPTEHIAVAMSDEEYHSFVKGNGTPAEHSSALYFNNEDYGWCLNYRGFIQYRYLLQNQ